MSTLELTKPHWLAALPGGQGCISSHRGESVLRHWSVPGRSA